MLQATESQYTNAQPPLVLGDIPVKKRVRIGSMVGRVLSRHIAIVEVALEFPERVCSAWFLPTCTVELVEDGAEAAA